MPSVFSIRPNRVWQCSNFQQNIALISLFFSLGSNFLAAIRIEHILSPNVPYAPSLSSFVALLHLLCCRSSANQQPKHHLLGKNRSNTGYKTMNTDCFILYICIFTFEEECSVNFRFSLVHVCMIPMNRCHN